MEFRKSVLSVLLGVCAVSAADYSAWVGKKDIFLNTSATGANVATTVTNFPVLIRLGAAESAILTGGGANGSGIRFSKADGTTALPYQIESWSSSAATIWVKVDSVKGNNSTQKIILHHGNPGTVTSESNGALVFDTANGFQAVWHLNEAATDSARDATVNRFNGVASGSPGAVAGRVGPARSFDGSTQHFEVPNSASGKLNFPLDGFFTFSAWAYIDPTAEDVDRVIVAKHDNQYALKTSLSTTWQFFEYDGNWQTVSSPYETGRWTHLTGVMNGRNTFFYVDGVEVGSIPDCCTGGGNRNETSNVFIGRAGESARRWWLGMLDEVRIANVARSADWVKLDYESQKLANSLTNVGQPSPPGAPQTVTGVAGNAQVTVSWVAPTSNGGAPITLYKAYAVSDTAKSCTTTGALTCTVTGLANGTGYTFEVKATNAGGRSVASAPSGTVTPVAQVPGKPLNVTAVNGGTSGSGSIVVTWSAPASNGGAAITAYKAYVSSDTAKSCSPTTLTGTLTCTISGLAVGTAYTFQVKATNSVGTGLPSDPSSPVSGINPGAFVFNVGNFTKAYAFQLPENVAGVTVLTLSISDVTGKTVWSKTINPSKTQTREIAWNGLTAKGAKVASGLYIARVKTNGSKESVQAGIKLRQD